MDPTADLDLFCGGTDGRAILDDLVTCVVGAYGNLVSLWYVLHGYELSGIE
jgi:hypothetical protein